MNIIDSRFSPSKPICVAEGRYQDVVITQGGVRPSRWIGTATACTDAGIDAPAKKPEIVVDPTPHYYVARTDVTKPGAVYYSPPPVSYEFAGATGPDFRSAKSKAYLEQSAVSEIVMDEGGKYYPVEPTVKLGDTHGKNGSLKAVLDSPEVYIADPNNSPETGITGFLMVSQGPPWDDEAALPDDVYPTLYSIWEYVDVPLSGNGIVRLTGPKRWFSRAECGTTVRYAIQQRTDAKIVGYSGGTGAIARVFGAGHSMNGVSCTCSGNSTSCFWDYNIATGYGGTAAYKMGKDYSKTADIAILIPAVRYFDTSANKYVTYDFNGSEASNAGCWARAMIIRCYSGEDPRNPGTGDGGYPVKYLELVSEGDGYLVAPQIKITSSSGFGAYATCTVKDGKIDEIKLENGGGGYTTPPTVEILSGGAEAFAVSRPHLRGIYQTYYRYTDDTPEDRGGPIPSNLSPVHEVDVGEHATSLTWTVDPPVNQTDRVTHIELWRSTSGQATSMYRVARLPVGSASTFLDDLTDEELRDPDRQDYAVLPILLPNGELNAMRFVPPPDDKDVVVRFQDRMWYGVGGELPNAIYYSEVDEPESVPEENEVIIQQNDRDDDTVRAMMPFGSTLYLAQERHLFALTFSQIPLLDGQVQPAAFRGCINQKCWQVHDGYAYVADHYGLYRIPQGGGVENLSDQVFDIWEEEIDFNRTTWNYLTVDYDTRTVRLFIVHLDDGPSDFPTRALCYGIDSQTFWWEKFPLATAGASQTKLADGSFSTVHAADGGLVVLDRGGCDIGRGSVVKIDLQDAGSGYRTPPRVWVEGGQGAILQASLNADGGLSAIWILEPGRGYKSGNVHIGFPNDPSVVGTQAVAVFDATPLDMDTQLWTTFHVKTGNSELITDAAKDGGVEQRRDLKIGYSPTQGRNELSVRFYYNNSSHPRSNVAERDRGAGFVDSVIDPASRMDLGRDTELYGLDPGVARAIHTGKTFEDMRGNDKHVAIEVCGPRRTADQVVLYGLDIAGTSK